MSQFSTPYRSKSFIDSYYSIAFNGVKSPMAMSRTNIKESSAQAETDTDPEIEIETEIETESRTGTGVEQSGVYLGDSFVRQYRERLDIIEAHLDKQMHEEKEEPEPEPEPKLEQGLSRTETNSSIESWGSDLEVELEYKMSNYIKRHIDDDEKVRKMNKLRNILNQSIQLEVTNTEYMKELIKLVDSLTES